MAEVTLGGHRAGGHQISVAKAVARWLDTNEVRLSPKTAASYRSLARLLEGSLGARAVGVVNTSEVQRAVATWQKSGLSASRIRQAVGLLSRVLDVAVHDGTLSRNPCAGVRLPPMPTDRAKGLSPAEADDLVSKSPERWRPLLMFLNYTGTRWAEAVALTWGQVDLERRRVVIDRSLSQVDGRLVPRGTKSGRARVVPIPQELAEVLSELAAFVNPIHGSDLVFTAPQGGPIRYDNFYARVWAPMATGAGVHAFRRAAITRLLEQGTPPHLVQAIVGHTDPKLTMSIYAAVNDTALDSVWG